MNVATPTRVLSLCAGGGGLDLGLRLAVPGARTVCYVENEVTASGVLVTHMADGGLDDAPLWTDLRTFDGAAWRGVVDCVIGGYPCQPFSNAGRRLGADDPRHLWPAVGRIVDAVRPRWCFFENVGAHLRLGGHEVTRELQGMGYEVACVLLTAEEVGAPHGRERLFILARRGLADPCGVPGQVPVSGWADGARGGVAARSGRNGDAPRLADTTSLVQREQADAERTESRGDARGAAGGRGSAVEHAPSIGRGEGRPEHVMDHGWDAAPGAGSAMADRDGLLGDGAQAGSGETRPRREALVNTDIEGLEGRERTDIGCDYELPTWPPGPEDDAGWAAVIAVGRLDLLPATPQPEVRGVADGMAGGLGRSDQLHILGNGVVPQQAARAFQLLYAALTVEETK